MRNDQRWQAASASSSMRARAITTMDPPSIWGIVTGLQACEEIPPEAVVRGVGGQGGRGDHLEGGRAEATQHHGQRERSLDAEHHLRRAEADGRRRLRDRGVDGVEPRVHARQEGGHGENHQGEDGGLEADAQPQPDQCEQAKRGHGSRGARHGAHGGRASPRVTDDHTCGDRDQHGQGHRDRSDGKVLADPDRDPSGTAPVGRFTQPGQCFEKKTHRRASTSAGELPAEARVHGVRA